MNLVLLEQQRDSSAVSHFVCNGETEGRFFGYVEFLKRLVVLFRVKYNNIIHG